MRCKSACRRAVIHRQRRRQTWPGGRDDPGRGQKGRRVDLIALASHGYTGLARFLHGSVAAEIAPQRPNAAADSTRRRRRRHSDRLIEFHANRLWPYPIPASGTLARRRSDSAEDLQLELHLLPAWSFDAADQRAREYIPREAILAEIQATLAHHAPGEIDHISFVGSGEPTLHSGLGWMIRAVRQITTIPVAVITNGVLLHRADVRAELLAADIVMPTVSAGTAALYQRIHRPTQTPPLCA